MLSPKPEFFTRSAGAFFIETKRSITPQTPEPRSGCSATTLRLSGLQPPAITISEIEFAHQIKKGQFDVSILCSPQTRTPQVWEVELAA